MQTQLTVFKAEHGDCILVKTFDKKKEPFVILIDGGPGKTYNSVLKKELGKLDKIDLLVLTHIDADHIKGLIKFIESPHFDRIEIKKYWINSKNIPFINAGEKISYSQGVTLEKLLISKGETAEKWIDCLIAGYQIKLADGIEAEIISPTQEILELLFKKWPDLPNEYYQDEEAVNIASNPISQIKKGELKELAIKPFKPAKSLENDLFNSSSIAFLLKMHDMTLLLLGDARPEIYLQGLKDMGYSKDNKLSVDFVKISHHGSKNNTSVELMDMLNCNDYIISTNGGLSGHALPDRETIARIVFPPARITEGYSKKRTLHFNYSIPEIEAKAGKFITVNDFNDGNWGIKDENNNYTTN